MPPILGTLWYHLISPRIPNHGFQTTPRRNVHRSVYARLLPEFSVSLSHVVDWTSSPLASWEKIAAISPGLIPLLIDWSLIRLTTSGLGIMILIPSRINHETSQPYSLPLSRSFCVLSNQTPIILNNICGLNCNIDSTYRFVQFSVLFSIETQISLIKHFPPLMPQLYFSFHLCSQTRYLCFRPLFSYNL